MYNVVIEEVDQVNHEVDMVVSQMKELQQHLIKTCDGHQKELEECNQEQGSSWWKKTQLLQDRAHLQNYNIIDKVYYY